MKILYFCPRWGNEDVEWDSFCKKVKSAGYDGIESPVSMDRAEKEKMGNALLHNELLLIGHYHQSFEADHTENLKNYRLHLENIIECNPIAINAQTGKDYFSFNENSEHFNVAEKIETEAGIPIYHETHRGRALFAAHITKQFLDHIPGIKLTADFSHWCCVAETLLDDQRDTLQLACSRSVMIHSRIGHPEGPQVNDPRAPEWKDTFDKHLEWWDGIILNNKNAGKDWMPITTEFGPAGYLPVLPFTGMPVASQWDINAFMLDYLKKRYQAMGI